ncbi:MAG: HNH endonuclease, partial [Caulobacteraceae bacterium]|nr:HNH endonuclease [Caulobacteraceae bacterium]
MLTSCLSCGRLIQLGSSSRCTDCKPKRVRRFGQAKPYQTKEWQAARRKALSQAGHTCCMCGTQLQLQVHHRLPLSEGGSHDQSNLAVVCRSCHPVLEARDRKARGG